MFKKAGAVAAIALSATFVSAPAFASTHIPAAAPASTVQMDPSDAPSFATGFATFNEGGKMLGEGAAKLISGAYTGIAFTPRILLEDLQKTK